MIHHVTRATRHLIFWTLLIIAIGLSTVRLVLRGVEGYKSSLEDQISELVGAPVQFKSLGTKMRGFSPSLVLKNIDIASNVTAGKPAIHLEEIRLSINLAEFVFNRELLSSSSVTLVGAQLSITRNQDGQFVVEGLKGGDSQPLWLFQGRQYTLLQSQITWKDEQKKAAPIILDDINLAILNEGSHHQVKFLTVMPKHYGDDLKAVMDFYGNVDNPLNIKGRVFIEGNNINLPKLLSGYLPMDIRIEKGAASFKLWSKWQHAQVVGIKGLVQLRQARFMRTTKGNFTVENLDTQFQIRLKELQQQLDIDRFVLETSEPNSKTIKKWTDMIASVASEQATEAGLRKFKLYIKQLDLAELSKLVSFFAPLTESQTQLVDNAQVSGALKNLSFYAEPDTKKFAIAGWFDALGFQSVFSVPGIANLSGQIKGSDLLGKVALTSEQFQVKAYQLFGKDLLFSQLNSQLTWQQTETEWVLASERIQLNCPAFQTESRLNVQIPKADEKPFVDLQTSFNSEDMSKIASYLPEKIMTESLKTWIGRAFVSGQITKGGLLLYGSLKDFPFGNGAGVFEANFDMDKVDLNFNPMWPHIIGLNGQLFYDHNTIHGILNRGQIGKVEIKKADALIPELGNNDEHLMLKAEVQGDINQVLSVLQQSPLARRVTPFIKGTTMEGTTTGVFDMAIPLWAGRELKIDGNAQFNNARLTVKKLDLKVDKIVGALKYNMEGIYSDPIRAFALGHPIETQIDQNGQDTLINVEGVTKVSDIESLFDWPRSTFADGEGPYQLQLQIPKSDADTRPMQINIKSTLEGFEIKLPGTLAKTTDQKKPSTLTVALSDEQATPIKINYNNELKAELSLNTTAHKINSGSILVGTGDVKPRRLPGIKLEINRDQLPLQDWLGLGGSQNPADESGFNINEIKINTKTAFWKKTKIGPFELALTRKLDSWSGEVDNSIAKGTFQIPTHMQDSKAITLDMDVLNLSALKQFKLESAANDPTFKPLFNIHSKKTLWLSENIGQLAVETERAKQGLTIKRLSLESENAKLSLSGDWKDGGLVSITHLKGQLDMKKADQLFDQLQITKDLSNTSGMADIDVNWNAAPWQFSVPNLKGHVDVDLTGGRILSVEPGFGRILGILAVAQWLKRLQLDFSDIYEEGLTFNTIKGHFDLLNGKAVTKDLTIDAIPAMITISGETDLVEQTLDQHIKVVPKSLDAVPIAGTILGEIASLVGKTLTGKNQEGLFFGTQYLVKGSWSDAKITSLHENEGLFPQTWHSITDFSWLEENRGQKK